MIGKSIIDEIKKRNEICLAKIEKEKKEYMKTIVEELKNVTLNKQI